jgi:hypothetical protein
MASAAAVSTVTVDGGGGGDYLLLQDAIDSFTLLGPNAGATPPFTINVVPAGGPYDEALTLNSRTVTAFGSAELVGDLTIQSSVPGTLAQVRPQLGQSGGGDGIQIYQSNANVTFIDLLITPSLASPATDDLIKPDENPQDQPSAANTVRFENCIFTPQDASGEPFITDLPSAVAYFTSPPAPGTSGGTIGSGDMVLKSWNDAGESLSTELVNCILAGHEDGGYGARIHADGGDPGDTILIDDSMFIAVRDWHAALNVGATTGTVTITGTDAGAGPGNGTFCLSKGWHGIWFSGSTASAEYNIDNAVIYAANPDTVSHSRGLSAGSTVRVVSIADSMVASNYFCFLHSNTTDMTWDRCTFIGDDTNASSSLAIFEDAILGSGGTLTTTDCIFASTDYDTASCEVYNNEATTMPWFADYCVFPLAGPHRVVTNDAGEVAWDDDSPVAGNASGEVNINGGLNNVFSDPAFIEFYDPTSPSYLDVDNPALAGVGSGGSNLAGGADYIGSLPVEVSIFSNN